MPGAAGVVHALVWRADEGADLRLVQVAGWGDDDQHAPTVHWIKGLAAQRVAFEHADGDGRVPGPALEQVDQGARRLAGQLHFGQVVVARGGPGVDREGRGTGRLDHLAEGREGRAGQRLDAQR